MEKREDDFAAEVLNRLECNLFSNFTEKCSAKLNKIKASSNFITKTCVLRKYYKVS